MQSPEHAEADENAAEIDPSSKNGSRGHELEELERTNCLIKLDYPYHPRRREWSESKSKVFRLLDAGSQRYASLLDDMARYGSSFEKIQVQPNPENLNPAWANGWFPGLDALSLYALLAIHNPRQYVEVGSGNSTMFARQAIKDHGLRTKITSIDPFPRVGIDSICDKVVRLPCEDAPSEIFDSLASNDILFVDNSHRSFPNSDVTVFFTEILPQLAHGVIYGLHDIFLPWDYPDEWKERFYNEQYLLTAYLLGGADGDMVVLPNAFVAYHSPQLLTPLLGAFDNPQLHGIAKTGTAFWLRRREG